MMPNLFGLIILQLTFALQLKVVFSALGKLLLLLPNLVSMILGCLFAAIPKFFFIIRTVSQKKIRCCQTKINSFGNILSRVDSESMEPAPALHVGAGSTRAACAMAQTQRPRAAQAPPSWHRCSQHQPSAHPANCCAVQPLPLLRPCRWAQPCGWGATARSARGCCRCTRRAALRPAGI